MRNIVLACMTTLATCCVAAEAQKNDSDAFIIHEWGTFTALMDGSGKQYGGVTADDEPVPVFVHNALPGVLGEPRWKSRASMLPNVTMRLETPIIYAHLPSGVDSLEMSVEVDFPGGWLTEHYPRAELNNPGLVVPTLSNNFQIGKLEKDKTGTLRWPKVIATRSITDQQPGPDRAYKSWVAGRQVAAANIQVGSERERFLFYRGVGSTPSPISIKDAEPGTFSAHAHWLADTTTTTGWLVDIRHGKGLAWKPITLHAQHSAGKETLQYTFPESSYHKDNVLLLRKEMLAALQADGLYLDEAEAMLNTWQAAYFEGAGLRIFSLVPQSWTDSALPLRIHPKPDSVVRSMIARLEIVRPQDLTTVKKFIPIAKLNMGLGHEDDDSIERKMLNEYYKIGRFRHAILLEYLLENPEVNPGLFQHWRNTKQAPRIIEFCGRTTFPLPTKNDPATTQ